MTTRSRMTNRITVVTSADEAYVTPMVVMMYSATCNSKNGALDFVVLDGGIHDETKECVEALVEQWPGDSSIQWVNADTDRFSRFKTLPRLSLSAFSRLLVSDLLPGMLQRLIYLDGDIVVEEDLENLWCTDLKGNTLGAVQDYAAPYVSSRFGVSSWKDLGLDARAPHFNAGVLLIDFARWRAQDVGERALKYLERYGQQARIAEQETLNVVLRDEWLRLDPRWNQMHSTFSFSEWSETPFKEFMRAHIDGVKQQPYIVHYTSRSKPWMSSCRHPLRHRYEYYLKESGWKSALAPPPDFPEPGFLQKLGRYLKAKVLASLPLSMSK